MSEVHLFNVFLSFAVTVMIALIIMSATMFCLFKALPQKITDQWREKFGDNLSVQLSINFSFIYFLYRFFLTGQYRPVVSGGTRTLCDVQRLAMSVC